MKRLDLDAAKTKLRKLKALPAKDTVSCRFPLIDLVQRRHIFFHKESGDLVAKVSRFRPILISKYVDFSESKEIHLSNLPRNSFIKCFILPLLNVFILWLIG